MHKLPSPLLKIANKYFGAYKDRSKMYLVDRWNKQITNSPPNAIQEIEWLSITSEDKAQELKHLHMHFKGVYVLV